LHRASAKFDSLTRPTPEWTAPYDGQRAFLEANGDAVIAHSKAADHNKVGAGVADGAAMRPIRGNIRGNIQIVHCVLCVQIPGRFGRDGRIGRI
jgi:hypothetical protein